MLPHHSFDEEFYLKQYPDVAGSIRAGHIKSGLEHYLLHGMAEGRRGTSFDEAFYRMAYPGNDDEIAQAGSAYQHYLRYGCARGYLPYAKAKRPLNPADEKSPYGGLWIDAADVEDRIAGRLEAGLITKAQADLLATFVRDGYIILPAKVPAKIIDAARRDLDRAYEGGFPQMRFDCPQVSVQHRPWSIEMNAHPSKSLDIHYFSQAVRDLIFSDPVTDFLKLIFESSALASQTLGFLRGSAQEGHQDSAFVPYTLGRNFAASWIALEDVTEGAGELFYHPGSHRLPDFRYAGEYKSVSEATRNGHADAESEIQKHVRKLADDVRERNFPSPTFLAKKGDVLIWHADLVHGGSPISKRATRRSIVTHYSPRRLLPLYTENAAHVLFEHGAHRYLSSHYGRRDQLER